MAVSGIPFGGGAASAQGLPQSNPAQGFTPGIETNQFGSWGAAVEQGGIPGTTEGLQQQGNPAQLFNPGDVVAPQRTPLAAVGNVPSTYSAPIPPPQPAPVVTQPSSSSNTPTISVVIPPTAAPPPPPPPPPQTPNPLSGPGGSYPSLATQTNSGVEFGFSRGGAIPAYDDGGDVGQSDGDSDGGNGIGPRIPNINKALDMARQSFGLNSSMFASAGSQSTQEAQPVQPSAEASQGGKGAIPSYDDGGEVDQPASFNDRFSSTDQPASFNDRFDTAQDQGIPSQGAAPAPTAQQGQGYGGGSDQDFMRKATDYLSGKGAMPQAQFEQLKAEAVGGEQGISHTQANMKALERAAEMGSGVATGAVQYLKSQYEPRRIQAARAFESGAPDVGAQEATKAMDFVPDGHEVSFVPNHGGQDVTAVVQDPDGKVDKAVIGTNALGAMMKGKEWIWDNVVGGIKGVLGKGGGEPGAEAQPNPQAEPVPAAPIPGTSRAPTLAERTSKAVGQFLNPESTEPTFAKSSEGSSGVRPEDQPYGKLNPKTDEAGGAGGGFGGPPGAPAQGKDIEGVNVREGTTAKAVQSSHNADAEWAAHQRQALASDQRRPAIIGATSPERRRAYAAASGGAGLQVEGTSQNESEFGERLPNGGRRLGPSLNMAAVPPGWRTAPDEGRGWVALPPGVTPKAVNIKMWTADGTPVNVRGFDHWDPNRLKYAQVPDAQGRLSSQEVFPNPPEGGDENAPAQRTIPGANYPELTGEQPRGVVGVHSVEPDTWDKKGHPLHYSPHDRYYSGGHEINMQAIDPNAVPTGETQAGRRPSGQTKAPVDRSQVTGTAEANNLRAEEHQLYESYSRRLSAGEELTPDQTQWMKNHEARVQGARNRSSGAPVSVGGNGSYPRLHDPAQRTQLPANVPYYYDPNGVLRHNPNYRGQ